jgi:hypothetical protein
MTYQRPSITTTNALPTTANGLASPPPYPPGALVAPRVGTRGQRQAHGGAWEAHETILPSNFSPPFLKPRDLLS